MKLFILTVLASIFSLQAIAAGHVTNATITGVYCGYEGIHNMCSVSFDKNIINKNSCHTLNVNRMQFSGNGEMGAALLSIALAAQVSQKSVDIYSTGLCTVYDGISDIQFIEIKG